MKILMLAQGASQDDISMIVTSFPADTEYTLLTGSECNVPNGRIVKTTPHDSRSLVSRFKCWIGYARDVMKWAKSAKSEHFDVIYANSNPPVNSFLGCKLKKKFNAPFVYMNWDLYPQIVEETYSNFLVKAVCRVWHFFNSKNYPKIDRMVTIGPVMAESINKPLSKKIDIDIIPIASDPERLKPIAKEDNLFIKQNGLYGKFIVLYSGKLGYGHNISAILGAAELLKDNKDIMFVFIGKGPKCEEVNKSIEQGAENVRMFPFQDEEMFKYSIACGDLGIISQEETLAHLFLPSKTYSAMSCAMPVIGMCSEHDDLRNLIDKNEIGISVPHATPEKIRDAVLKLYNSPDTCAEMGARARKVIESEYTYEIVSEKYKRVFLSVSDKKQL